MPEGVKLWIETTLAVLEVVALVAATVAPLALILKLPLCAALASSNLRRLTLKTTIPKENNDVR